MPSRLRSICEDELMAACLASHASARSCARWLQCAHALWRIAVAHLASVDHIGFVHAVAHSQGRQPPRHWRVCGPMCYLQTTKECLEVLTLVRAKDAFFEHYKR